MATLKTNKYLTSMRITCLLLCMALFVGCYYDNEETLYPPIPGELSNCDTLNVSYTAVIVPLLETHCSTSGCHRGNIPAANMDLTDYDDVKKIADNGEFYGSIAYLSGFSRMPKNANQLPECDIRQVKAWIDAGANRN